MSLIGHLCDKWIPSMSLFTFSDINAQYFALSFVRTCKEKREWNELDIIYLWIFTTAYQRDENITFTRRVFFAYFEVPLGDQDKNRAPHHVYPIVWKF